MELTPDFVTRAEARIHRARLTVDEFCKLAQIDRVTWTRWKNGANEPRVRTLRRVEAVLDGLTERAA